MSRPRVSLLSLLLGFIVLLFSWFVFFLFRFPDEPLVENLPGSYRLRDRYGELITDIPKRNGYFRPYTGSLAPRFVELLLTVEDRRFRQHLGVDLFAKIRALFDNIRAGKIVSGASTITEQYIKNHYFRAAPRTLLQKLRESALALRVSVSQ
jgi:membrane carboxypeptidase/penicillin-binding protein PbpC